MIKKLAEEQKEKNILMNSSSKQKELLESRIEELEKEKDNMSLIFEGNSVISDGVSKVSTKTFKQLESIKEGFKRLRDKCSQLSGKQGVIEDSFSVNSTLIREEPPKEISYEKYSGKLSVSPKNNEIEEKPKEPVKMPIKSKIEDLKPISVPKIQIKAKRQLSPVPQKQKFNNLERFLVKKSSSPESVRSNANSATSSERREAFNESVLKLEEVKRRIDESALNIGEEEVFNEKKIVSYREQAEAKKKQKQRENELKIEELKKSQSNLQISQSQTLFIQRTHQEECVDEEEDFLIAALNSKKVEIEQRSGPFRQEKERVFHYNSDFVDLLSDEEQETKPDLDTIGREIDDLLD